MQVDIYASELKNGYKVYCQEEGWQIVKKIKRAHLLIIVTFENGKEKYYSFADWVTIIRK